MSCPGCKDDLPLTHVLHTLFGACQDGYTTKPNFEDTTSVVQDGRKTNIHKTPPATCSTTRTVGIKTKNDTLDDV